MPVSDTLDGFCEGAAFWFGQSEGHFGCQERMAFAEQGAHIPFDEGGGRPRIGRL